jgi:4-hydroxybenzoate polyprenyltransferase
MGRNNTTNITRQVSFASVWYIILFVCVLFQTYCIIFNKMCDHHFDARDEALLRTTHSLKYELHVKQ